MNKFHGKQASFIVEAGDGSSDGEEGVEAGDGPFQLDPFSI